MSPLILTRPRGIIVPPPITTFTPNLPSGMLLYVDSDLTRISLTSNGSDYSEDGIAIYGTTTGGHSISRVEDPTAPWGNTNVLKFGYPGNTKLTGGGGGLLAYSAQKPGGASGEWAGFYAALSMKFDADYVTHTAAEKLFYPILHIDGVPDAASITLEPVGTLEDVHGNRIRQGLYVQDVPGETASNQSNSVAIIKGEWNTLEWRVRMNTAGHTDGIIQHWVNGQNVYNITNQRFHKSNINGRNIIQMFRIDGTQGAGASDEFSAPDGQARYFNRLALHYEEAA